MKISLIITTFNEEKTIAKLLESLFTQTRRPNEIVVVDGGSEDRTVEIIRHFQKKNTQIKLLVEKCSRAKGRNLGVEISSNDIIAMTDAGCVADRNWLKKITEPFKNEKVDMVAGFYKMKGDTPFQKALSFFLGTLPSKFDVNFLPSTRSIAFRKKLWLGIGGFPENLEDTAEDTVFNLKVIKSKAVIARVKNARVEWGMPETLNEAFKKMFLYAKGDARSKIWWHPTKKYSSHNIKILLVFARYLAGLVGLIYVFKNPPFWPFLILILFLYIFWAYRKVFIEFEDKRVALWGIILQFTSDFAGMSGFLSGITDRGRNLG
jgi:glycosyltransferase involved in cell wall biosynthesis